MGKKIGKKLGNDDLFLIFYNFCCNSTFYMRSEYVGGTVLYPARARQVYAPKRHKHPIFRFGRILAFFAKNILRQMCLMCANTWRARGIWKFNTWWVFDRYFIPPKNSKILVRFYLRNWRFLDKKCQNFKNFSFAQNDPISLLNPWNRFI